MSKSRTRLVLVTAWLACFAPGREAAGQSASLCEPVLRFLTEDFGMVAEIEGNTISDARTGKELSGCLVTAAGGTAFTVVETAELLYEQMATAGWGRSPDPRDVPSRHILRFRMEGADCLFGVYTAITDTIGSEAQLRVNRAYVPYGQDERFNVLVQCVPAMEARS